MAQNLIIVESPAKGKTIENYLGKDYRVIASFGHVRDLPKTKLGVDVSHNFAPDYVIPVKAKKVVAALKAAAAEATAVYLATDYDREGEAIAWHIVQACGLDDQKSLSSRARVEGKGKGQKYQRITFHEITESAIKNSLTQPRALDLDLIDAQQARRVLDRLVGYKLSPFLWQKVTKGLSAGRVQSVAVRLIVDREREIEAFKPQEYWEVEAEFAVKGGQLITQLQAINSQPVEKQALTADQAKKAEADLAVGTKGKIIAVDEKETARHPFAPFRTATLQQEASSKLGFSAKQTMRLAQDLYEAGLITYMRTDSTNLASQAVEAARALIKEKFGAEYLPAQPVVYSAKAKGAQEAHEAIRPTHPEKPVESVSTPSERHSKLYDLVWRRLIASQMNSARVNSITAQVAIAGRAYRQAGGQKYTFVGHGQRILFAGFMKVYQSKFEERLLPKLENNETAMLQKITPACKQTEPPHRYSEASLVKALEKFGIGRPSTYAPTIATIQDRNYVRLENKAFVPEEIGKVVTDLLVENFPEVIDIKFTAAMEKQLDDIAESKRKWQAVIEEFYAPFTQHLAEKLKTVKKSDIAVQPTDEKCPLCQKPLVLRYGKFGRFYACTGFPDCKYTRNFVEETGFKCPDCQEGSVVALRSRKGRPFFGCSNYPKCKYMTWDDPRKTKNKELETKV